MTGNPSEAGVQPRGRRAVKAVEPIGRNLVRPSQQARKTDDLDLLIGRRLRERRILLAISQEELARRIGLSFQQLQKYEVGENRISAARLFVGGRKSHAELWPEVVAEAKRLRRASPKTGKRLSFREISNRLGNAGRLNERGEPFNPQSVRAMIEGPQPRPPRVKGRARRMRPGLAAAWLRIPLK